MPELTSHSLVPVVNLCETGCKVIFQTLDVKSHIDARWWYEEAFSDENNY